MQPTPEFKVYYGSTPHSELNKPAKRFIVYAPADKDNLAVQKAVQNILNSEEIDESTFSITINELTDAIVTYKTSEDRYTTIDLEEAPANLQQIKVHLQAIQPSEVSLPVSPSASFRAIWKRFMQFETVPVQSRPALATYKCIAGFFKLIVSPFIALHRYYVTVQSLKIQNLKIFGENNYSGYLFALEEGVALTAPTATSTETEQQLHQHMKDALELGRKIDQTLNKPEELTRLAKEHAAKIAADFEQSPPDQLTLLGEIPSGYYREGTFYPMMLSFYRGVDNELYIEKLVTDPKAAENTSEKQIRYQLKDRKVLDQILIQSFSNCRELPKTDQKERIAYTKQVEAITQFRPITESTPTYTAEDPAKKFDDMLVTLGATLQEGGKQTAGPSKADPWTLIRHWIRHDFPDTPLADKVSLSLAVTNYHVKIVLAKLNFLPAENRKDILATMQKEIKKLHRVVDKAFGKEKAFTELLTKQELVSLKQQIDQLQNALQQAEGEQVVASTELWQHDMHTPANTALNLSLKPVEKTQATAEITPTSTIFESSTLFTRLEEMITAQNVAGAKIYFDALKIKVNILVDQGDYAQAAAMSTKLLNLLPVPSLENSVEGIWKSEPMRSAEMMQWWAEEISDVTQCLWESKLRLGDGHIWPEERIALLTGRALIKSFMGLRVDMIKEKILPGLRELAEAHQKRDNSKFPEGLLRQLKSIAGFSDAVLLQEFLILPGLSQGYLAKRFNLSWEEIATLTSYVHMGDADQALSWINNNPYLLDATAEQDAKIRALRAYFASAKVKFRLDESHANNLNDWLVFSDTRLELSKIDKNLEADFAYKRKMSQIFKGYNNPKFEKENDRPPPNIPSYGDVIYKEISIPTKDGATFVPPLAIILRRNLIMTQCVMHPEASVYLHFPYSALGSEVNKWLENLNKRVEGLEGKQRTQMLRNIQQIDLIKRLKKMGRLDFRIDKYVIGGEPQIIIVSRTAVADEEANYGLVYRPQGLKAPRFLLDQPNDMRNLDNSLGAVGDVPQDFVKHWLDPKERENPEESNRLTDIPLANDFRNETTSLIQSIQNPSEDTEKYAPLDRVTLSNLKINKNDLTGKGVDSSALEAFDRILQKPELLEDEQVQRVYSIALFRPFALFELLKTHPEFVAARLDALKDNILKALKDNRHKTAAFLMFVGDRIKRQVADARDQIISKELPAIPNKKAIPEITDANRDYNRRKREEEQEHLSSLLPFLTKIETDCPDYDTNSNIERVTKSGVSFLQDAVFEENAPKKFLMTYILDWLRTHPKEPKSVEAISLMLYGHYILKTDAAETALPLLQHSTVQWMEHEWIPQLFYDLRSNPETIQRILNSLYKSILPNQRTEFWVHSENNPYRFSNQSGVIIDVRSGSFRERTRPTKEGLQPLHGSTIDLPSDVRSHPQFTQLFGDYQVQVYCSPGRSIQELVYQFETADKRRFRIDFNHDTQHATFYQWFDPKTVGEQSIGWYRHEQVQGSEFNSAAQIVSKYGVWRNPKLGRAFVITSQMDHWKVSDLLVAKVKQEGILTGLHTFLAQMEVCQDSNGVYSKWFGFTPSDNLLFLRKANQSYPSEIRILDKNIILQKQTDGSWVCSDGPYKGYRWERDYSKLSQHANTVRASLGSSFDATTLILVKGKEEKFVIWPYSIASTQHTEIALRTELSVEERLKLPTLELSIVSEPGGEIEKGSAATFLYLSYLFQGRGDYKRAFFYLEKARRQGIDSAQEKQTFQDMVNKIARLPAPKTLRAIAFQLKAELAIAKIQNLLPYDPKNPEKYIADREHILGLYNRYNERLNEVVTHRHHIPIIEEELNLTDLEQQEFTIIRSEALMSILHKMLNVPMAGTEKTAHTALEISRPPKATSKCPLSFIVHLLTFMTDPKKEPTVSLETLSHLNQNNILKYFWHYWNKIEQGKLKPDDPAILALYAATTQIPTGTPEAQTIASSCELARRLLLERAELNVEEKLNNLRVANNSVDSVTKMLKGIDIVHLFKLKEAMPTKAYPKHGLLNFIRLTRGHNAVIAAVKAFESPLNALLSLFIRESEPVKFQTQKTETPLASAIVEEEDKEEDEFAILDEIDAKEQEEKTEAISKPKDSSKVTMQNFLDAITADSENTFSQEEITAITTAARQMSVREKQERTIPELVTLLASYQVNLPESRRLVATVERINQREQRLRETSRNPLERIYSNSQLPIESQDARDIHLRNLLEASAKPEYTQSIEQVSAQLSHYLHAPAPTKMAREEQELQALGLGKAKQGMLAQAKENHQLLNWEQFEKEIKTRKDNLQSKIDAEKETLLNWTKNAPPKVAKALAAKMPYGEAAVIEKVLDLYQQGFLDGDEIEKTISLFLLYGSELKQINKVMEDVYPKWTKSSDPDEKLALSTSMYKLLHAGAEYERHFAYDIVNDRRVYRSELLDPRLNRKMLVSEYRQGIIFTEEQRTMIKNIRDNPNVIALLRMGKGKSSVIMPTVIQVLTEQNMLVGILITEKLWLHRESMDRTTRDWFDQAANQFDFDINMPMTPAFLAGKYDDLLRVKEELGYFVTTIERRAALENKLTSVANEISALNKARANKYQLMVLKQQEMWLRRIKHLLDGDDEHFGFRTQYFQDEGDEISDVRVEINQQLLNPSKPNGGMRPPNQTVINVSKTLFNTILDGSVNELSVLREAILQGRYASIDIMDIRKYIDVLAQHLLNDKVLKELGLEGVSAKLARDPQKWLAYITGKKNSVPLGITLSEQQSQIINALKHILSIGGTLEAVLQKGLNTDFGVRGADEVVVVPREDELEKINVQFGDEYELVLSHYLQYAAEGPGIDFCMHNVNKMKLRDPELYQRVYDAVNKEFSDLNQDFKVRLRQFLKSPAGWEYRLEILERFVLSAGYISLAEEQITLNVHSLLSGLNCGMASGTAELANLPESFSRELCQRETIRETEAETYLRIGMSSPMGLNEPAIIVPDKQLLEKLKTAMNDDNLKSCISLTSFGDLSAHDIIHELRNSSDHAKTRQYIYVDSSSGQPVRMMWNPKDDYSTPYNRDKIDPQKCFFLFLTANTRGIDFPVPTGPQYYNILINGPTTSPAQYVQGSFRLRQLGEFQRLRAWCLESVAERISEQQKVEVTDITEGHVINDITYHSEPQRAMLNYKAAIMRPQAIAIAELRKVAFEDTPDAQQDGYWSVSNPQLFDDIDADAFLFDEFRSFMIQSKEIDFTSDLMPTSMVDVIDKVKGSYKSVKDKLDLIEQSITKEQSIATPHGRVWKRYSEAILAIGVIKGRIENSEKEYIANFEEVHSKYLAAKVPNTATGKENSMSFVQQQQQQQQLQQQSVIKLGDTEHIRKAYKSPDFNYTFDGSERSFYGSEDDPTGHTGVYKLGEALGFANCGLEKLHLHATESVKDINGIVSPQGEPFFRLLIIDREPFPLVCWIGTLDYYQALRPLRTAYAKDTHQSGIYSISDNVSQVQIVERIGNTFPDTNRPEIIRAVAVSRFLMGFSNFTPEERREFAKWVKELSAPERENLIRELKERGYNKQIALLNKL